MDNNDRFGRIEDVLADVLVEMHGVNAKIDDLNTAVAALQQGQQQIIRTFGHFAGALLAKMDEQTAEFKGSREDIKLPYNHEERLRKIETAVFQTSA